MPYNSPVLKTEHNVTDFQDFPLFYRLFLMRQSLLFCLTQQFWRRALNFPVDETNRQTQSIFKSVLWYWTEIGFQSPCDCSTQCYLWLQQGFKLVSVSRRYYRIQDVLQLYDPEDCSPMCVLATGKGQHEDYQEDSSRNWNVKCFLNSEEDKVHLPKSVNRERKGKTDKKLCNIQTRHQEITLLITGIYCIFLLSSSFCFLLLSILLVTVFCLHFSGPTVDFMYACSSVN